MQTATSKRNNRPRDTKSRTQTKISGFFAKPIQESPASSSRPPEGVDTLLNSPDIETDVDSFDIDVETRPLPTIVRDNEDKEGKLDIQQQPGREVIVIEDSPVRPITANASISQEPPSNDLVQSRETSYNLPKQKKQVHPFFTARQTPGATTVKQKSKKKNESIHEIVRNGLPPWPTIENCHCGNSEWLFGNYEHTFPLRRFEETSSCSSSSTQISNLSTRQELSQYIDLTGTTLTQKVPTRSSLTHSAELFSIIPETHQKHPAISRLFDTSYRLPSNRMWNDKYAPRKAEEVIHNDNNARYLQSWLRALEVQITSIPTAEAPRGLKRPRLHVERAVDKRARKRQKRTDDPFGGLEDFIADEDEIEEEEEEEELDLGDDKDDDGGYLSIGDDLPGVSTISSVSSRVSSRPSSPDPPPFIIPRGTRSRPTTRGVMDPSLLSSLLSPSKQELPRETERKNAEEAQVPFTERLANTILLKGPCGSGKTATVYACAQELDWKVFEFYPGIGKRSGAGFMNEVGGTGENHRVGGISAHLLPEKENQPLSQAQGFGFLTSPTKKGGMHSPAPDDPSKDGNDVRQSLILIEEADILYPSDGNFWPTLISFIRKSRRPVIITCNDASLIPLDALPLQCILEFGACDVELATSYLQAIAKAEGQPISRSFARELYTKGGVYHPINADIPDQPMHPLPSQGPLFTPDLKRAINLLQFRLIPGRDIPSVDGYSLGALGDWSQALAVMPDEASETLLPKYYRNRPPHEDLELLVQLEKVVDAISFADAHVDRRFKSTLELESTDRFGDSGDDVQGYTLLSKEPEPEEAFGVALWPRDADMAVCITYQARLQLEKRGYGQMARRGLMAQRVARPLSTTGEGQGEAEEGEEESSLGFDTYTSHLALRRAAYQGGIVEALDEKLVLSGPLMPRVGCMVDYIPWMQVIVRKVRGEGRWMSAEGQGALVSSSLVLE